MATHKLGPFVYTEHPNNFLGGGSFGQVWRGKHASDATVVAIKKIMHHRDSDYWEEAQLLRTFTDKDSWIVKCLHAERSPMCTYIVMELCEGSLASLLKTKKKLQNFEFVTLVSDMRSAVVQLHEHSVIHRDLKPQNILYVTSYQAMGNRPAVRWFKLADFGCARILGENDYAQTITGTKLYMAPEITLTDKKFNHYDERCDIFSIGAVLYECAVGQPLISDNMFHMLRRALATNEKFQFNLSAISSLGNGVQKQRGTSDLQLLLSRMLEISYKRRYDFGDFVSDPFAIYCATVKRIVLAACNPTGFFDNFDTFDKFFYNTSVKLRRISDMKHA